MPQPPAMVSATRAPRPTDLRPATAGPMLAGMRSRLLGVGVVVAAVAAVALWLGRDGDTAGHRAPAGAAGPRAAGGVHAPTDDRPTRALPRLPRRPKPPAAPTSRGTVSVGGITIENAGVYDPESADVKANLFEFKKSRLRFALYDAATECWAGDDDVADLQVTYTMIVEGEVLRLENVAMTDSTMPDPAIEQCILAKLRELRSPATDIPDLREDGSSWIALHDLYARNRRQR